MAMRVLDLNKFALEQIWRPYWPTYMNTPSGEVPRLTSAPRDLDETVAELQQQTVWRDHVIRRLALIGVTFPHWVRHPLVDLIKDLLADPRTAELVAADRESAHEVPWTDRREGDTLTGTWSVQPPGPGRPGVPFAGSGDGWLHNPIVLRPGTPEGAGTR